MLEAGALQAGLEKNGGADTAAALSLLGTRPRKRFMELSDIVEMARAATTGQEGAMKEWLERAIPAMFGKTEWTHLGTHLGMDLVTATAETATMRMAWQEELRRAGDIFHGGAIMALADHVAGCVFNLDPRPIASGTTGLTTDFHATFLRAAPPGDALLATGRTLRRGRTATFIDVEVVAETSRKLVAAVRTTYVSVPLTKLPH
jgi:uncharacterized protein (TIGR00369 family)